MIKNSLQHLKNDRTKIVNPRTRERSEETNVFSKFYALRKTREDSFQLSSIYFRGEKMRCVKYRFRFFVYVVGRTPADICEHSLLQLSSSVLVYCLIFQRLTLERLIAVAKGRRNQILPLTNNIDSINFDRFAQTINILVSKS